MKTKALHTFKFAVLAAAIAVGLGACGDKGDAKKPATQVAAKVNSSEISVHQINAVLAKAQGVPPESAAAVRKEILDKLVDQQLAYDQAVEKKLDRNPDVMMAIESAKREIVARAYLEQMVAGSAKASDDEVRKYYAENPNLFANRRIYNIQEITLEANPEILGELKQMVAAGKPMEEIATFLKAKSVKFRGGAATRPAEQLPFDVLPKLAALKDGQALVIEAPQNYLVMRVAASQSQPVDEATAAPRIKQFLQNQAAQKLVKDEMARLKAAAKIEYLGEFAANAAPATPIKPDAAAQAAPAPAPATPAAEQPKPAEPAKPAANIEKGVAGLK